MRDAFCRSAVLPARPRRRWHSRVFAAGLRGVSLMVAPLAGQAAIAQSEPVPPDSWARRQEIAQLGEITPNVAADFDPVLGTHCWVTQAHPITSNSDPNFDDVDVGPPSGVTLTSPRIPGIFEQTTVVVEFSLWYASVGAADADDEVLVLWDMGAEGIATIAKLRPKNSRLVWQRFRGSVGTGSAAVAPRLVIRAIDHGAPSSLEVTIDDVTIHQVVDCEECCDADINDDGNVDQDDVLYLTTVIGGGPDPVGIDPDFNRDGNADQDDITALINKVGGGPCP